MQLNRLESGSYVDSRDPGESYYSGTAKRVSVTEDEARILAWLAYGCTVLELGTGLGISTRALASQAKSVVTIDIDPWVQKDVWPELPDNVEPYSEVPEGRNYELVFVDGCHTAEAVKADIRRLKPLCTKLMVFHDVNYAHIRDAVQDAFPRMHAIDTVHGLGLVFLNG